MPRARSVRARRLQRALGLGGTVAADGATASAIVVQQVTLSSGGNPTGDRAVIGGASRVGLASVGGGAPQWSNAAFSVAFDSLNGRIVQAAWLTSVAQPAALAPAIGVTTEWGATLVAFRPS